MSIQSNIKKETMNGEKWKNFQLIRNYGSIVVISWVTAENTVKNGLFTDVCLLKCYRVFNENMCCIDTTLMTFVSMHLTHLATNGWVGRPLISRSNSEPIVIDSTSNSAADQWCPMIFRVITTLNSQEACHWTLVLYWNGMFCLKKIDKASNRLMEESVLNGY